MFGSESRNSDNMPCIAVSFSVYEGKKAFSLFLRVLFKSQKNDAVISGRRKALAHFLVNVALYEQLFPLKCALLS